MKKALVKRALGYDTEEVIEEYSQGQDGIVLTKKKVTKKNVPPDISALKALLELTTPNDISSLTDEELEKEKQRLLDELYKKQKKEEETCKIKRTTSRKKNSTKN